MNDSPMITVVVTAYNIEKHIGKCLKSVNDQTYRNFEVIVVNDGSTDKTGIIVEAFCQGKSSFRYIRQENAGVSVARNVGIDNASGDYIMFVDGDDYLDDVAVQEYVSAMGEGTDILCSCCHAFSDKLRFDDHFFDQSYHMDSMKEKEKLFLQLLNGSYGKPQKKGGTAVGVPWGKLYRTSFLKEYSIRFDSTLRRMEDNIFNMYAFYHARNVIYYDKPFYNYRLEHIQTTRYTTKMWLSFLEARDVFFFLHPEMNSGKIHEGYLQEKYVRMMSAALWPVKELKYRDAVRELDYIRNNPVFSEIFNNNSTTGIPLKYQLLKLSIKFRLYMLAVLGLKLK